MAKEYKGVPVDLCDGVTFEPLEENEFTKAVGAVTRGFVRLQPYNQVWDLYNSGIIT